MAEVKSSARGALKAIRSVVNNCNGQFGPTMIFLTGHSKKEINVRLSEFIDQLSILARDK
jgi:hypothetical protein